MTCNTCVKCIPSVFVSLSSPSVHHLPLPFRTILLKFEELSSLSVLLCPLYYGLIRKQDLPCYMVENIFSCLFCSLSFNSHNPRVTIRESYTITGWVLLKSVMIYLDCAKSKNSVSLGNIKA